MPDRIKDKEGRYEFTDAYTREFDMALRLMVPSDRAGYLDSAYSRLSKGKYSADILEDMAELLLKWSTEKVKFDSHAEKLRELALATRSQKTIEAEESPEKEVRDFRGESRELVNKVLSYPPGPLDLQNDD